MGGQWSNPSFGNSDQGQSGEDMGCSKDSNPKTGASGGMNILEVTPPKKENAVVTLARNHIAVRERCDSE